MICLEEVVKFYGTFRALNKLSFSLKPQSVSGFLGPNGAGKTTTMRLITTYLGSYSGQITVAGFDGRKQANKVRNLIGYLPENCPLYADLTAMESLEMTAALRGLSKREMTRTIAKMVDRCGLTSVLKKPISVLSKGYRQRIGLAQAMIHEPQILILDEPTNGLDPNQMAYIRQLIRQLGQEKTVLISTHILHQVPQICDRVLVLNQGSLVFDGTPGELSQSSPALGAELVTDASPEEVRTRLAPLNFINEVHILQLLPGLTRYLLQGTLGSGEMIQLFTFLKQTDWLVAELTPQQPSLDHIFGQLTT